MPNSEIHCAISKARTGSEFKELHDWMDEPQKWLGHNHRIERHSFNQDYKDFIMNKWGEKAVVEWLFHIAIDNLETANKFAFDIYSKNYENISFDFEKKYLIGCEFHKKFENSVKITKIEKKGQKVKSETFGRSTRKE